MHTILYTACSLLAVSTLAAVEENNIYIARMLDNDHIGIHVRDLGINVNIAKMSDEERQFYYFKLHDYNNDSRLDGIEIMASLMDHHFHKAGNNSAQHEPETALEKIIDKILLEEDLNNDGFLDYSEFATARRKKQDILLQPLTPRKPSD